MVEYGYIIIGLMAGLHNSKQTYRGMMKEVISESHPNPEFMDFLACSFVSFMAFIVSIITWPLIIAAYLLWRFLWRPTPTAPTH